MDPLPRADVPMDAAPQRGFLRRFLFVFRFALGVLHSRLFAFPVPPCVCYLGFLEPVASPVETSPRRSIARGVKSVVLR